MKRKRTDYYKKYKRIWREKNSLKNSYINLKAHAKERNVIFNLTFDEFCDTIQGTLYMLYKGIRKHDLTLDRIENEKGYVKGNIRVIENIDNLLKEKQRQKELNQKDYNDLPF